MSEPIDRELLLEQLIAIKPGISRKGIVELTDCITFREGRAHAYNGNIAASAAIPVNLNGTVKAKPLLEILDHIPDKKVRIFTSGGKLVLKGRGRMLVRIPLEDGEFFRFHKADRPKKWSRLDPEFCNAIRMAFLCSSRDVKTQYLATMVKITSSSVQALDNAVQFLDYKVPSKIKDSMYNSVDMNHVCALEPSRVCDTRSWLHFKNGRDVRMSFLKADEPDKFPSLKSFLVAEGHKFRIPKALGPIALGATVFTKDNKDENFVKVTLSKNEIRVQGISDIGEFNQPIEKVKYDGPTITFAVSGELLNEIATNYPSAVITQEKMVVSQGPLQYAVFFARSMDHKEPAKKKKE